MAKTENGIISGSSNGTVVEVEGGQNILIDVTNPDLVVFSQEGSNLVITNIADGQKIVLDGFFSQAGTELPPQLTLADGSVITAQDVTGLVEDFDPGQVAPAAGPGAGGDGGGASFSAYGDAGIGEGIGISGLLDPTDLGFPPREPIEDLVALPGQPDFLLNEIGMGTFILDRDHDRGEKQRFVEDGEDLYSKLAELNSAPVDSFLELTGRGSVDFIELRNATGSSQSTAGNGPSTVGDGVTTISIIGPNGDPVSFDLPNLTIVSGGQLVVLQSVQEGEGEEPVIETIFLVFDADGNITSAGSLGAVGDWPMGADTTDPLGVLLSWSLNGDVGQVDTFLANGARFVPEGLNNNWVGVPEVAAALDIFGDSDTFSGQISTQEVVSEPIFDAYAPISLDQIVAEGPLGEDFFHDIDVNNIFSRVDNFDSNTAGDWTTNQNHTIGLVNDINDPNPQDPYNDDMNPGQPTGPGPVVDEATDSNGQNVILLGDDEDDSAFINEDGVVEGGRAQDFIIGDGGSNTLDGGAHNDYLDGGAGNDVMYGNSGGDVIIDDQGNDILIGGTGTDVLFGRRGPGDDMYGGYGNDGPRPLVQLDSMYGGSGEIGDEAGAHEYGTGDLLIGDEAFFGDNMYGGGGNDQIPRRISNDIMYGGYGNSGMDPQDYMRDIIVAGDGSDIIFGDNAELPDLGPDGIGYLHYMFDQMLRDVGDHNFNNFLRNMTQFYYGGADLIYGGWGDDFIFGQGGDDLILAGHGDDVAAGGSGNDIIRGNSGEDTLYGGFGNDTMYGGNDSDFMMGNEGNDIMYGDSGNDSMYGGYGEDTMYGGTGRDRMYGNSDDDVMYGNSGDDRMYGGSGDDLMYGGTGYDQMYGGSGDDVMYGNSGDDRMHGGSGDDSMYGGAGNDDMHGDSGADLMYGGTGSSDTMFGGSEDDVMYGDSGQGGTIGDDDLMYGNSGSDTMLGEGGNDVMYGDNGYDAGTSGASGLDGDVDVDWTGTNFSQPSAQNLDGDFGVQADPNVEESGSSAHVSVSADGTSGTAGYHWYSFTILADGTRVILDIDGGSTVGGHFDSELNLFDAAGNLVQNNDDNGNDPGSPSGLDSRIDRFLSAGVYYVAVSDWPSSASDGFTVTGDQIPANGTYTLNITQVGAGEGLDNNDLMFGGAGDDIMYGNEGHDAMYGGADDDLMFGESGDDTMSGGTGNDDMSGGSGDDLMFGNDDDDTMSGGTGDDNMYGGSGADLMFGNADDDVMSGGDGADTMSGGAGNDLMFGDAGNDDMSGDAGDDVMYGGTGDDVMSGGAGNDLMSGGDDADTMSGDDGNDFMLGDAGDDVMSGNDGDDVMSGGAGNDVMSGGSGNDQMFGGEDDDLMVGDSGNDEMRGGLGNDDMSGGSGDDLMFGDAGDDIMSGGFGADTMNGGAGSDEMTGGEGNDLMFGGADDDLMEGNSGNDVMHGGSGNDDMSGGGGNDLMFGDAGDDVMDGNDGEDTMFGGAGSSDTMSGDDGNDIMYGDNGDLAAVGDDDVMYGGAGEDLMYGEGGSDLMYGGADADNLFGGAGADTIFGDEGNDYLSGQDGDDVMYGGAGDDELLGGDGDDEMSGGAGNDELSGGIGADTMLGDDGDDVLFGNDGDDLMSGGAGNDEMSGGAGNDEMHGGADQDVMSGGSGDDVMFGDGGNDVMYGESGNDAMSGGAGADLMYGGTGDDEMSGGAGDDTMYGGSGSSDTMFGGDGNDAMYGDNGDFDEVGDDDHMYGGAGDDYMLGGGGNDAMYGEADNDVMDGWTGDDVMYGGAGDDDMLGYDGDDVMSGGAGNDTMDGEADNDVMDGGTGEDLMFGGAGNDLMDGGDNADVMYGDGGVFEGPGGQLYGGQLYGGGLYGVGNDTMQGGAGSDLMYGDNGDGSPFGGDDVMYGGAGGDDMFGEGGDDTMFGDGGRDFMSGGFGNDDMSGGAGKDTMNGGFGNDVMSGGAGEDTMDGGFGNDVMNGDGGNDVMFGYDGDDDMSGGTGSDAMYGGYGDDTMSGGNGHDVMLGGSGDDDMSGDRGRDTMDGGSGSDDVSGGRGADTLQWTMSENAGEIDNYDGGQHDDTLELYFTAAEFAAHEAAIAKFANDVEDTGTGSLVIGGRTLNADNIEFVAVHVDGAEVPVLIDDSITTDEDTDITQQITADPNTQDFIPNAQTTTFNTPSAVTMTLPLGGGTVINFDATDWNQVGDVWTLDLVDDGDDYGQLVVDATNPEAVTATLDIPEADGSAWEPMDTGDVATVVFDYSASIEGSESATVTINVNGVNDAPVAVDDIVITNTLDPIFVPKSGILANDTDIDEDEVLAVDSVTAPASIFDDNYIEVVGANRVENPSFEDLGTDVNVDHGSWGTYNSLPGWNVDRVGADAPIELQVGGTGGIQAQDGNYKMELDSHNEGGYTKSNAHVYQDIPTSAGEELTLSFWYSPRTSSSNGVRVVWNGVEVAVLDGDVPGWQEFTFEVEGTDGTTRLEFQGLPSENTLGGYIDNIYVGDRDFDYVATDGDETDTAHVDVQYQVGNELIGGDENEIIIAGDDADTLSGNGGDDTLIGGEGDDVLIGGEGDDEYHFGNAATDGDDTILGFETGEEGDDTINLDALFDELGIAAVDRAADITIDSTSGSAVITVDGQADFSITVSDVDLGNGNFTSEELAAKGIVVSDES